MAVVEGIYFVVSDVFSINRGSTYSAFMGAVPGGNVEVFTVFSSKAIVRGGER